MPTARILSDSVVTVITLLFCALAGLVVRTVATNANAAAIIRLMVARLKLCGDVRIEVSFD